VKRKPIRRINQRRARLGTNFCEWLSSATSVCFDTAWKVASYAVQNPGKAFVMILAVSAVFPVTRAVNLETDDAGALVPFHPDPDINAGGLTPSPSPSPFLGIEEEFQGSVTVLPEATQNMEPFFSKEVGEEEDTEIDKGFVKNILGIDENGRDADENIVTVVVSGSHFEMGIQYGTRLKSQLHRSLDILKKYFITEHHVSYDALIARAEVFNVRYSYTYDKFLEGVAQGAQLSVDDCKILNAMETLNHLVTGKSDLDVFYCLFLFVPPSRTMGGQAIIARNYDFPPPFNQIAKQIVVTIYRSPNKIPTASIAMPGQIYCPTCINNQNLFLELNNGGPSGGFEVAQDRTSLLIQLLEILRDSDSYDRLRHHLMAVESDYSLIINSANQNKTLSFEYSSTEGRRTFSSPRNRIFVSTNFFLNQSWPKMPIPTDNTTWMGVTRRNNILTLTEAINQHNITTIQAIMNVTLKDGGALWDLTIYQIIYDYYHQSLFIRSPQYNTTWTPIFLGKLFAQKISSEETSSDLKVIIGSAIGGVISGSVLTMIGLFAQKRCKRTSVITEDSLPLLKEHLTKQSSLC